MRKNHALLIFILLIFLSISAQKTYSGYVIDTYTQEPIPQVEVSLQGTNFKTFSNHFGFFSLSTDSNAISNKLPFDLSFFSKILYWQSDEKIDLKIYNALGLEIHAGLESTIGNGQIDLSNSYTPINFIVVFHNCHKYAYKINTSLDQAITGQEDNQSSNDHIALSRAATLNTDTLLLSSPDYYSIKYSCDKAEGALEVLKKNYDHLPYLNKIIQEEAATTLQGNVLSPVLSEVKAIKVIYSIPEDKVYFANTKNYLHHYYFCTDVLGYDKGPDAFNNQQYRANDNRIYYLGTLNHYTASDIYALHFYAGDEISCSEIKTVYNKVIENSFLGDNLYCLANTVHWSNCGSVPIITTDELYENQNYQPLNPEISYGYLKKVDIKNEPDTYLGKRDIVLLNDVPGDMPVVAGIITTEFQTPLSHINVLSHNRGTPNMGLKDGWSNPKLEALLGKLVRLSVEFDSFSIYEVSIEEAEAYWASKDPQTTHVLAIDTTSKGLVNISQAGVNSVASIGGKASNFAELAKVEVPGHGSIPLPEGAFAIPFYYYQQHIKANGLDIFIQNMLEDSNFESNATWRQEQLTVLRDSITNSPIDSTLLQLVKNKVASNGGYTRMRFRSSTNAEDIEGFNGAGLYDSYTGKLDGNKKTIERAIKRVWASLWNYRAVEERSYFKIDQKSIAMGVLAHRSFPEEDANGVVITQNLYRPGVPAITINVQVGEISVVDAEESYVPDQIIYYTDTDERVIEYINHSDVPEMEDKTVMTDDELEELKEYCMAIYEHYCTINSNCAPLDIEFKVDVVDGERIIYIKQARLY